MAVAHSQAIRDGNPQTTVLLADLRQPDMILGAPAMHRLIDLNRPVGVLMLSMLHFLPDADGPAVTVARLREAVAPGSFLATSHATQDGQPPQVVQAQAVWNARSPDPIMLRTQTEVLAQFGEWRLVEPGVVHVPLWRPDTPDKVDEHPQRFNTFAGMARKDRRDRGRRLRWP
ncbi:MAG TPA: SAM-dependent methyltransferase [Pseudonocardiaceae bacterium]|nr:SAM-dependent methyltransferase [Pseudonocardiaceae bacterium]